MEGEAETHSPPREEKAEGVRKADNNRRGRNCPDVATMSWALCTSVGRTDFPDGETLPAKLCTSLEQGHTGESGFLSDLSAPSAPFSRVTLDPQSY